TIVHGHGAKGGAYARLLSLFCGVKSIYTPHGGSVHRMFGLAEETVYTAVEKALLRFTDYCLFESRYSADAYFAKVGREPKAWSVNHNGVPAPDLPALEHAAAALKDLRDEEGLNIGVFGILRPQKGQSVALKAAAELVSRGLRFRMHFFGRGPDREALEAEAARLGLGGKAVFHGEADDPSPYMFLMDTVLIPSLFESFGYVAIEAFSIGRPVAAAATGGLREIIADGETGLLFAPGDPAAMAVALARLADDPGLRRRLGDSGRSCFSGHFLESHMLDRARAVYARPWRE
ncbi:MAG TPA: glycosyltransferase family 4 protein, partial [Elusimicrobiales bacterium]|nr:glycosyltransferase family 4 protein [Elusimicrobiales bacterium]